MNLQIQLFHGDSADHPVIITQECQEPEVLKKQVEEVADFTRGQFYQKKAEDEDPEWDMEMEEEKGYTFKAIPNADDAREKYRRQHEAAPETKDVMSNLVAEQKTQDKFNMFMG